MSNCFIASMDHLLQLLILASSTTPFNVIASNGTVSWNTVFVTLFISAASFKCNNARVLVKDHIVFFRVENTKYCTPVERSWTKFSYVYKQHDKSREYGDEANMITLHKQMRARQQTGITIF